MKADVLRRLEALEQALSPVVYPVLTVLEVHTLPDEQRTRYWNGDATALEIPSYPDLPTGTIHTIIVDVGAASRDEWLATRHLSDEEQERRDEQRIRDEDAEPVRSIPDPTPVPRFDKYGYRLPG